MLSRSIRSLFNLHAVSAFVLAALVAVPQASADFFQFSTTVTPGVTTAGGTQINLTPVSSVAGDNLDASGSGTDIVFGNIDVVIDRFAPLEVINLPFTFQVTVGDFPTDFGGSPTATDFFTITGAITGTVGSGKKVNLNNYPYSPSMPITKLIGNQNYTFSLFSYLAPGPGNTGGFGVHVTSVEAVIPEPGTLTLMGLGAAAVAIPVVWRRRKAR